MLSGRRNSPHPDSDVDDEGDVCHSGEQGNAHTGSEDDLAADVSINYAGQIHLHSLCISVAVNAKIALVLILSSTYIPTWTHILLSSRGQCYD